MIKVLVIGNSLSQDALDMDEWDYIVTQQASHDSGIIKTYETYLSEICKYIRTKKKMLN